MNNNGFTVAVNMPVINNCLTAHSPQEAHFNLFKKLHMNVNTPTKCWFSNDKAAHELFNMECNPENNAGIGIVSTEAVHGKATKPLGYTEVLLHTGQRVAWRDDGINLIRTVIG